ncbi:hypothetical protein Bdiaspc4_00440 [Bradyrhizobium diazoefficiens]|nr:hypothetical protein CO678_16880 [Bradyrhizobium diazoefficiens]QBP19134.1 hypothetical protein Bdiaspc4_00440 [Bradyrhizobium diazoefficiens]
MPRLDRGIQYAAAPRLRPRRHGILDRPAKPGDDTYCGHGAGHESRPKNLTSRRFPPIRPPLPARTENLPPWRPEWRPQVVGGLD